MVIRPRSVPADATAAPRSASPRTRALIQSSTSALALVGGLSLSMASGCSGDIMQTAARPGGSSGPAGSSSDPSLPGSAGDPGTSPGTPGNPGPIPDGETPWVDPFVCDPGAAVDPGPAPLQRLTPAQYRATARELFGDVDLSSVLPPSASSGHIGLAQPDPSLVDVEAYASAAERIAQHVSGDLDRFAPCSEASSESAARDCAGDFLADRGGSIFRGPLSGDDVTALLNVFDVGFDGGGYENGIRLMVRAMLQSPRFLYRPEMGRVADATPTAVPLTDHELATRLSFAFWNQGPDRELLAQADAGSLSTPAGLQQQVQRLMDDPRARTSFRDFLFTWLGLGDLDTVEKDTRLFPEWTGSTSGDMRAQADAYFDYLLFGDNGTLDEMFAQDPANFSNDGLSSWSENPASTAGILTLPALLSTHSKSYESFPIYRGLLVREQFLCQTLPPPPADVAEVPEAEEGVSTRERFSQHSTDPLCQTCHRLIDPLGFAFENFDAVGRYRTSEQGHPVDASGELIGTDVDGPFANLDELAARLRRSETVRSCVSRQWFRFVTQRFERPDDGCSMQALNQAFAASGYRFDSLRAAIVETPAFRMRRPITEAEGTP